MYGCQNSAPALLVPLKADPDYRHPWNRIWHHRFSSPSVWAEFESRHAPDSGRQRHRCSFIKATCLKDIQWFSLTPKISFYNVHTPLLYCVDWQTELTIGWWEACTQRTALSVFFSKLSLELMVTYSDQKCGTIPWTRDCWFSIQRFQI